MPTYQTNPNPPQTSYEPSGARPLYRAVQIVWYLFGILEVLLVFRFILKLLAANPSAAFTNFIYILSEPFVSPFVNVFGASTTGKNVIEWATLLAMLVYWIIAALIARLFVMGRPVSAPEARDKLQSRAKI